MTHKHEWIYQQSTYGHYECPCGETLHCVVAESRLNATEELSASDARLRILELELGGYAPTTIDALRAYAEALDG